MYLFNNIPIPTYRLVNHLPRDFPLHHPHELLLRDPCAGMGPVGMDVPDRSCLSALRISSISAGLSWWLYVKYFAKRLSFGTVWNQISICAVYGD